MYTLQNIKDEYYYELAHGYTVRISLEDYIKEYYVQCYDEELNFIGYDKR